jgi:hypothetical protein
MHHSACGWQLPTFAAQKSDWPALQMSVGTAEEAECILKIQRLYGVEPQNHAVRAS